MVDRGRERTRIEAMISKLSIRAGDVDDPVATLSGGNQQKVVIAKWLMTGARIVLLNDPTRGIDVGTKQEMYQLLRELADAGTAILFYTTDYDELIGCCDRVAILYAGRIIRQLAGEALTETQHRRELAQPAARDRGRRGRAHSHEGPEALARARTTARSCALALFVVMFAIYIGNHAARPDRAAWSPPPPTRACCSPWSPWRRPCRC